MYVAILVDEFMDKFHPSEFGPKIGLPPPPPLYVYKHYKVD